MTNDEVNKEVATLQVRVTKATARAIRAALIRLLRQAQRDGGMDKTLQKTGKIKLKHLVKRGQLEELAVNSRDMKELKKILNKNGVAFSIMKDKVNPGQYSVFFQSKNLAVMENAFKEAVHRSNIKHNRRESVINILNKFKEEVRNTMDQQKTRHKHQEQSL